MVHMQKTHSVKTARLLAPKLLAQFWAILFVVTLMLLQSAANAKQPSVAQGHIVSLELDSASRALFKATTNALYRSDDEGRTWIKAVLPPAVAKSGIAGVTTSAADSKNLYVAGKGAGVMRSQDGGKSWTAVNKGLPKRQVAALTAHAEQPSTVYAYINGKGIYRSQDAGAQWRLMDRGPRDQITGFVHSNMPGSMESGWLFAATPKGVWRSMDCFCGWHKAGEPSGAISAVAYDPDEPQHVYAGGQEGLLVSSDGGEQWTSLKFPGNAVSALTAAPSGLLYAAGNDGLYRSRDRGRTWEKIDAHPSA